ncbi:MAG: polysaccharide deacetylase family protein [Vampirovibrionales bacterium]|nr:polysaccharide deacetylase family protein [Vampirovibrionales bacterium]
MLVMNFHHVEENPSHRDRKVITITPKGLRNFIRTLRKLGFEIVSMRDVLAKSDPTKNSDKQVLITFDDGFVNNYENAWPVLEEEKCPATIFLLPGRFSGTNEWDHAHLPEAERDQLMSLEQIREMGKSKYITYGSHGLLHVDMRALSDDALMHELNESHNILARDIPESYLPVLAYPWGYHDARVVKAMENTPYRYAFTVEKGKWTSVDRPYEVPRHSAYFRDRHVIMLLAKLLKSGVLI